MDLLINKIKFVGPIKDHSLQKIGIHCICRGMRVFVNVYGIYIYIDNNEIQASTL